MHCSVAGKGKWCAAAKCMSEGSDSVLYRIVRTRFLVCETKALGVPPLRRPIASSGSHRGKAFRVACSEANPVSVAHGRGVRRGALRRLAFRRGGEVRRHRVRRQQRPHPLRGQRRRAALSGLSHQDDDALRAVRRARGQAPHARQPPLRLRQCRQSGAVEDRREARHQHPGGGCHPRADDQVSQRCRGGDRRERRRQRFRLCRPHEPHRPAARHELVDLPQPARAAQRRAEDDRARPREAGRRPAERLPAVLQVLQRPLLHLPRHPLPQPQPPARFRGGRRRHQDRLHPRPPASTWSATSTATASTSSRWSWAAAPPPAATPTCAT